MKLITCEKCNCEILPEHKDLSCHAHNDTNVWRQEFSGECYSVIRRIVIEDEAKEGKDEAK